MRIQEGVKVVFGGDAAGLLNAVNVGKVGIAGLVTFGVAKMAQFDRAARKTQREWERSMTEIATLVDMPREQIEAMRREMAGLSVVAGQTFKDMARARYDTISAGFTSAADSAFVLQAAAKGAVGGLTDISTSAKAVISILNSYGMEARQAARVNDLLFTTVQQGVTTYGELAANIGDVASTAKAANIPLEDLLALIATVTRGGINTAEAVTAVNQMLLSFIKQGPEARRVAQSFGIDINDLGDALAKMGTLADRDLELLTKMIPSVRGLKAAIAGAADEGERFASVLGAYGGAGGAGDRASGTMSGTLDHLSKQADAASERLNAAWGALTAPYETGMLAARVKVLTHYADQLERISGFTIGFARGVPHIRMAERGNRAGSSRAPSVNLNDQDWLTGALGSGSGGPVSPLRPGMEAADTAARRLAGGLSDLGYRLGQYQLRMQESGMVPQLSDPGWHAARYGSRFGAPPAGTGGFDLSRGGSSGSRPLPDSVRAAAWASGTISGMERDPWQDAQQKIESTSRLAGAVVLNLGQMINMQIGDGLVQAFGGGESAVARFAASAVADIAQVVAEAVLLRGILSATGLGGLGDILGLADFGLFSRGGYVPGYAWGGATGGSIDKHQKAGIVHAGEYVLSAEATNRIGRHNLDRANRDMGSASFNFGDINIHGTSSDSVESIARGILSQALPAALRKINQSGSARMSMGFGGAA